VYQEVVARTFAAHLTPHLTAGGYTLLPKKAPGRQTFEVIAYREPLRLRAYTSEPLRESNYGRELHIADFAVDGTAWRVLTAHFDSGTEAGRVRTSQLRHITELLGDRGVFAGDANLRKAEWEAVKDELAMTDAWEQVGSPATTRVTWRRDEYKARFDRVFVGPGVRARSMAPLGIAPLPGLDVEISDHIGLLVELAGA
jgi:endonuclease/exonuclease/phosphatase family metal-dependent hydrolase